METHLTELPYGLTGTIYRSAMPLSPLYDPQRKLLDAYRDAGIDTVVMLSSLEEAQMLTGEDFATLYERLGFRLVYVPVRDFTAPSNDVMKAAVKSVLRAADEGNTIVMHCHAGVGRTGTLAACLARVVFNLTGEQALSWVRHFIPSAVENDAQFDFVKSFNYADD